jgi:antibiotic biosynthesis monooxygenase (ABM) superfamily enzyme
MPTDSLHSRPTPVPPPSKHQLALMVWLAVLPTLTGLDLVLSSLLEDTPIAVRTFVVATIAVPIVMYGLMPRLHLIRARLLARQPAQ